jgi:hypothetical protein
MIAHDIDTIRSSEFPLVLRRRDFEVHLPKYGQVRLSHLYWVAGERPKTGPLAEEGKEWFWICQLTLKDVRTPVGMIGRLEISQLIPGGTDAEVFANVMPTLDAAMPDAIHRAQQQVTAKAIQLPGQLPPPPAPKR